MEIIIFEQWITLPKLIIAIILIGVSNYLIISKTTKILNRIDKKFRIEIKLKGNESK